MSLPPRKYFIEKEFPLPRETVWERWNEYPFKWTKNSSYSVVRRYLSGPTITPHIFVQSLAERASSERVDVPEEPNE